MPVLLFNIEPLLLFLIRIWKKIILILWRSLSWKNVGIFCSVFSQVLLVFENYRYFLNNFTKFESFTTKKMRILKMFLHISMKNPCSLFLTTIWMFLWRWGNNITLSKNSSNFKTLYWFSNYCKNDEMAVIIYCKHPTSVVPYTVKTSISMYSDIYTCKCT